MLEGIRSDSSGFLSVDRHAKASSRVSQPYLERKQRIQFGSFGYYQNNLQNTSSNAFPPIQNHRMLTSVSCKDGKIPVCRIIESMHNEGSAKPKDKPVRTFLIAYRIFRPVLITSNQTVPLVVLHGGPGIPSNYIYPLVDFLSKRTIIFFDQLGCGRSDAPRERNMYSIKNTVNDLETLLQKLEIKRFHLYGHSFGGIIAFEYLKKVAERDTISGSKQGKIRCLSVILSSAPSSIPIVDRDSQNLINKLLEEDDDKSTLASRFHKKYKCRSNTLPVPLADAYGRKGQIWCSTSDIADYVVEPLTNESSYSLMPPALIMRGEHDFVSESCVEGWYSAFNHNDITAKTLDNCSHHGLLEEGSMYGAVLNDFIVMNE